jgi:hypothetical protein
MKKEEDFPRLERSGIFSLDEVHSKIFIKNSRFNDLTVDMGLHNYRVFNRNPACAICGIVGTYYALERCLDKNGSAINHGLWGRWHFNLYHRTAYSDEILITKDHILPKSLGGKNELKNYQTMCTNCNGSKGNTLTEDDINLIKKLGIKPKKGLKEKYEDQLRQLSPGRTGESV